MTQIKDLIQAAYRETNIIPVGASPSSNEETEALFLFNRVFSETVQLIEKNSLPYGVVDDTTKLNDNGNISVLSNRNVQVIKPSNVSLEFPLYPAEGDRIIVEISKAGVAPVSPVTLISGPVWEIDNYSAPITDPSFLGKWVFVSTKGGWKSLGEFSKNDDFIFPSEFDDFFTLRLAARLAQRNGEALSELAIIEMQRRERDFLKIYRDRRGQQEELPLSLVRSSLSSSRFYL